jgi:hypothetical protein
LIGRFPVKILLTVWNEKSFFDFYSPSINHPSVRWTHKQETNFCAWFSQKAHPNKNILGFWGYKMDKNSGTGDMGADGGEIQIWPLEQCRFAYTLNNSQPVRCTWISDQPLFYTDYDGVLEDEDFLSDPLLQALEKDIADLCEKTSAYDKIAKEFAEADNAPSMQFRMDADFVTAPIAAAESGLEDAIEMLRSSRTASQYLSFAELSGVELKASNQVLDASYVRESGVILVRADLDLAAQVLLATRELRRMWQHKSGAGLHPLTFHPDQAVLVNRAQTADLTVSMIRTAWELQLSGYKDAWVRIENSPMADLGRAFAREAIADFRSLNNGTAAKACFESWFLSERCRKADRGLIQQMLADYQGYVFSDNPEASRLIATDLLKALGKMPFGQNYLSPVLVQIVNDPVFTDVRDRSNANFLWFIKFERSFTEAEKETSVSAAKVPQKASATILPFPNRKTGRKTEEVASAKSVNGDVVFFANPGHTQ